MDDSHFVAFVDIFLEEHLYQPSPCPPASPSLSTLSLSLSLALLFSFSLFVAKHKGAVILGLLVAVATAHCDFPLLNIPKFWSKWVGKRPASLRLQHQLMPS